MSPDAHDRVLLITGASSGIGAATARAASEAGWRLVLAARSKDKLETLADELGSDRAVPVGCDVTDFGQLEGAVATATDRFGQLDAVLANAGFGAKRGFLEESVEHWKAMVETNVLGVAYTIRAALPALLEADEAHMVLLSSIAGRRSLPGSLYSASKFAVTGMGEGLRAELRQMRENHSVKVTVVEPGMVSTPFFDDQPTGVLEPEDVARAIVFCLDQPAHVDINELLLRPISQPG